MFVKSILETAENGTVAVIIANETGTGEECLLLSLGEWKRMIKSLARPVRELDCVDEELYDALHLSAEKTAALREAARILSSGDKSEREIRRKLTQKGFSAEACDHAVRFLTAKGYLCEEDACMRIAQAAVRSKHHGKRRIVEYLCAHGYGSSAAKAAAESVPAEDYRDALAYQMEKKYPDGDALTGSERQKMIAAMMRQGFSAGEITEYLKEKHR